MDNLRISLEEIKLGTNNFDDCKCIGEGRYWKQYVGDIVHANKLTTVIAKRWDNKFPQSRHQFLEELHILNNEVGEQIIVYESASNGSLNKHLADASLSWMRRLKICIDVTKGLEFLHTSVSLMHRDIKSASILLDGDWKARISNLELSAQLSNMEEIHEHITADDNAYDSLSYVSEKDKNQSYLTKESDIYSLGVVLKEIFWGKLATPEDRGSHIIIDNGQEIHHHQDVFEGIKEQIDPKSFETLADIVGLCLAYKPYRPEATQVITQLEKALEFQYVDMMGSSSVEDTSDMDFFDSVARVTMTLKEIASATNNFADENIIARGSYGHVYKGSLLDHSGYLIRIVVRRSLRPKESFVVNDLKMYKNLKHKYIISPLKVDYHTYDQVYTIHKYEANESLDKHLTTLSWMQRLQICAGVAHALRYLHYGLKDDCSVIHGNIKSSKILLDHNWESKLHDFRCATKVKRHHLYLTSGYCGTLQYMDPAFESTGGLTHKSDVFFFGVVLFEVLFGTKASAQQGDNWYFAKMARLGYEENRLDDIIDRDL
ncbi:hypothetical protein R6Q57_013496 [Mikania cordata]